MTMKKVCQHCHENKPMGEYYENKTKLDLRNGICKDCQREVNKKSSSKK